MSDRGILHDRRHEGVLKEGGTKRQEAVEQVIKGMGGRLEGFYFAFGGDDFVLIADVPDSVGVFAATLVARASGTVNVRTTMHLTPAGVDEATRKIVKFRPAGT